jgi:hypothetical protein
MGKISCPICNKEAEVYQDGSYVCLCCGKFKITSQLIGDIKHDPYKNQLAKISSFLRHRDIKDLPPLKIFRNEEEANRQGSMAISIQEILSDFPKNIGVRIDNVLLNLATLSKYTGEFIPLDRNDTSIFYCDSFEETSFFFMLKQLYKEGYVEDKNDESNLGLPNEIRLTAKGWNRVNELEKGNIDNPKNVFVAMSFDPSLKPIYENSIKKAIIEAKYNPIRVDAVEYNDKICDEIISNIRKSKFVISDATQQKNGVYFEAGFAMGLGKPVIWTCRKDELSNLHFDTRQYNHIIWENEEDLYERLLRRIEATII